jgi:hypothetical protein
MVLITAFTLFGHDQARALELPRRVLIAGAPQKVLVIEPDPHVNSAGIAGAIVDHPIGRLEFIGGIVQPLIITTGVPTARQARTDYSIARRRTRRV